MKTIPTATARTYATLSCAALLSLGLAGCGSSGSGPSSSSTAAGSPPTAGGRSAGQGMRPGTSGLIAAVDGKTLQVQGTSEQTAVTYTASTRITDQVSVASSTLEVGDCVSARPAQSSSTSSSSPTAQPTEPTAVAAATVEITSTGSSSCTSGLRGGGAMPSGMPSGMPTGAPTGGSGGSGGGRMFGGGGLGAVGKVTRVGDGTFTVEAVSFARPRSGSSSSATASPTSTTRTVTVSYTGSTRFTARRTATASAVRIGRCVTAEGRTDDTGAVTATNLSLSAAVDGRCTGGFGRG